MLLCGESKGKACLGCEPYGLGSGLNSDQIPKLPQTAVACGERRSVVAEELGCFQSSFSTSKQLVVWDSNFMLWGSVLDL